MGDNRAKPVADRFWPKVNKTETCWLWTGPLTQTGYGYISIAKRSHGAHRVSLMLSGVEIPKGMVTDHLCRVRNCVRPDHLEVVTNRTNTLRGVGPSAQHAAKTRCIRGHDLSPRRNQRTYGLIESRYCRQCQRDDRAKPRVCATCGTTKSSSWNAGPTCRSCVYRADQERERERRLKRAATMNLARRVVHLDAETNYSAWCRYSEEAGAKVTQDHSAVTCQRCLALMQSDSIKARAALSKEDNVLIIDGTDPCLNCGHHPCDCQWKRETFKLPPVDEL